VLALAAIAVLLAVPAVATSSDDAFLGISSRGLRGEEAREMGLPSRNGALIEKVYEGTSAEAAGIQRDDVIVEFGGSPVFDDSDLTDLIDDQLPGDRVTIVVVRDGEKHTLNAELGSREDLEREYDSQQPSWARFLENLFGSGSRSHRGGPMLGVHIMEMGDQLAEHFGVEEEGGILITEVLRDTAAEAAGIRAGDVVVDVAGDRIRGSGDISDALEDLWGETITVTVVRDRKPVELRATLEEE
jgi:serine protease Do